MCILILESIIDRTAMAVLSLTSMYGSRTFHVFNFHLFIRLYYAKLCQSYSLLKRENGADISADTAGVSPLHHNPDDPAVRPVWPLCLRRERYT